MHHNLSWIVHYNDYEGLNGLALLSVYNDTSYIPIPTTAELRAEFLKKKRRLMESTLL